MKYALPLFSLAVLLGTSACSQSEEEVEPDYENMVMVDDEEENWMTDEERDRKVIVNDLPDPQEQIIVEPALR